MITASDIRTALVNEYVGKPYHDSWAAFVKFRNILDDCKINSNDFWGDTDRQTITLTYKRVRIGTIEVKKAKGQKHYSWCGDYCDWTFKDFVVSLYKNSIEECMEMAENTIRLQNEAKDLKKAQAIKIIKLIKENEGIESNYDIAVICDYICKNRWNLDDWMKEA